MTVSRNPEWLLLVFSLPAKRASERVGIWRKLRRYGALPMKSAGYVLPGGASNEEKFQWLAAEIRKAKGSVSVMHVRAIDDLPSSELKRLFSEARAREYAALSKVLQRISKQKSVSAKPIAAFRRQLNAIVERDFFTSPLKSRLESQLAQLEAPAASVKPSQRHSKKQFLGKQWVTRPRPGIDRVSCAWLIRRFIDPTATFVFAEHPKAHPAAIPFDMFTSEGFGHVGDRCSFETMVAEFGINDPKVILISQAVHDADLADEKFGRVEALGVDKALIGWADQGISDDELLRRGMEVIEGLYHSV